MDYKSSLFFVQDYFPEGCITFKAYRPYRCNVIHAVATANSCISLMIQHQSPSW